MLKEQGTHEELLNIENGTYAHLFRLQSEGYAKFNTDKEAPQKTPKESS
jgi:hypothetical protein